MKLITKMTPVAAAIATVIASAPAQAIDYEVWAADQSNSVAGASGIAQDGSFLQIFEGTDVETYAQAIVDNGNSAAGVPAISPIPCPTGGESGPVVMKAPCDAHDIFPGTLVEHGTDFVTVANPTGLTGNTLASSNGVGAVNIARLHGALPDPQHKYVNVNLFGGGRGYVGVVTADTKEAVALWRVTATDKGESLHMSFWSADGNALLLANLHGRILERIDFTRDEHGNILTANFNQAASMSTGATGIVRNARAYTGLNGAGNMMISTVSGAYDAEATALATPNGKCRQNGNCGGLYPDGSLGGRPGNVIVCPIVSSNDKVYVTFGGGGLIVADGASTPMKIVGEYGNNVINGAGCGGVEAGGNVWLNAGASASGAGATQSEFTMYRVSTNFPAAPGYYPENFPAPTTVYKDPTNTATGGATSGPASNGTGQGPGTTRRDAHGAVALTSGHYVHNVDRIQNTVSSFNVATGARTEYDLKGTDKCSAVAAAGVPAGQMDDVAPDLMDRSPNGDFIFFAARGPVPHSVTHSAQGACPGVGVIRVTDGGKSGELAAVVRTHNFVDDIPSSANNGGYALAGPERSDPHGVSVVIK